MHNHADTNAKSSPTANDRGVGGDERLALLPDRVDAGPDQRRYREIETELGGRLARQPEDHAPMIVAPERLVPGISARHCTSPTFSASSGVMSSTVSTRA